MRNFIVNLSFIYFPLSKKALKGLINRVINLISFVIISAVPSICCINFRFSR